MAEKIRELDSRALVVDKELKATKGQLNQRKKDAARLEACQQRLKEKDKEVG